ncbi:hypothetical protein C8T65DRAFT_193405 [Cerioporus squamosus]|nr:hypothetical protein C8T65DRAFT_193405 [Cerioporus squamosus]
MATTETQTVTETEIISDRWSAFASSQYTVVETRTEVVIRSLSVSVVVSSVVVQGTGSSASSTSASSPSPSRSMHVPVIVGGVCGGLVLVLIVVALCFLRRRRSRLRRNGESWSAIQEIDPLARRVSLVSPRPASVTTVASEDYCDYYEPTLRTSNRAVASSSSSSSLSSSPEPVPPKPADDPLSGHTLGGQFEEHAALPDSSPSPRPQTHTGAPVRPRESPEAAAEYRTPQILGATPLLLSTEGGRTVLYAPVELGTSRTPLRLPTLLRRHPTGGPTSYVSSGGRGEIDSGMRIHDDDPCLDVPPPAYTTA